MSHPKQEGAGKQIVAAPSTISLTLALTQRQTGFKSLGTVPPKYQRSAGIPAEVFLWGGGQLIANHWTQARYVSKRISWATPRAHLVQPPQMQRCGAVGSPTLAQGTSPRTKRRDSTVGGGALPNPRWERTLAVAADGLLEKRAGPIRRRPGPCELRPGPCVGGVPPPLANGLHRGPIGGAGSAAGAPAIWARSQPIGQGQPGDTRALSHEPLPAWPGGGRDTPTARCLPPLLAAPFPRTSSSRQINVDWPRLKRCGVACVAVARAAHWTMIGLKASPRRATLQLRDGPHLRLSRPGHI